MNVTVLMENTALEGCGLTPEAGLSLYIDFQGRSLLLDAGSSGRSWRSCPTATTTTVTVCAGSSSSTAMLMSTPAPARTAPTSLWGRTGPTLSASTGTSGPSPGTALCLWMACIL